MPLGNFLLFFPTKGAFTVFFRCLEKNYSFSNHHHYYHRELTRRYRFQWWYPQLPSSCSNLDFSELELLPLIPCPTARVITISIKIARLDVAEILRKLCESHNRIAKAFVSWKVSFRTLVRRVPGRIQDQQGGCWSASFLILEHFNILSYIRERFIEKKEEEKTYKCQF